MYVCTYIYMYMGTDNYVNGKSSTYTKIMLGYNLQLLIHVTLLPIQF